MPTTAITGPTSQTGIGTGLGDGVNYVGANNSICARVFPTSGGSNAYAISSQPGGNLFSGYNLAIDNTHGAATIQGIEVVAGTDFDGSGNSYIGAFGSSSGTGIIRCYLHNGTDYSSALTWDTSTSYTGISFSDSDTTATFTGANKRYINTTAGDDVLFGAADELHGLSWNSLVQGTWGFAIAFTNVSGTFVAGYLRGIGLRVTYTAAPPPDPLGTFDNASSPLIVKTGTTIVSNGTIELS